jgi:hypothetical protein
MSETETTEALAPQYVTRLLAEIDRLKSALENIEKRQWQHRETFHEGNAWPMAQKLNKEIVEIYAVARKALEDSK